MRVLVCGSRYWTDVAAIYHELYALVAGLQGKESIEIIEGGATGADSIAARYCREVLKKEPLEFPAEWKVYGNAAGPIRNKQMLDEGKPDLVLAFHSDLEHSRGTKDMVRQARAAGVLVRLIT
jgi:hypothetical protein